MAFTLFHQSLPICVVNIKTPNYCQHRCCPLRIDGSSADQECSGYLIREEFYLDPVVRLGSSVG